MGAERTFGENLKRLVAEAGLSVEQFSRALGVHHDSPQKWFAGKSYPHRKYHKKMAGILGVTVPALLMTEGHLDEKLPAIVSAGTIKEETTVDPLLTKTLLSINLRLDGIERSIVELKQEVKTHQHPLASRARHPKTA